MTILAEAPPTPRQAPRAGSRPIGEELVARGLLTAGELETALHDQSRSRRRLGEVLVELGFIDEDRLLPFLSDQLQVPSTRLREALIDPQAVKLIPRTTAEGMQVIALFKVRDVLTVAMADPQNLQQIDEIERVTRLRVRPVLALQHAITKMIARGYEENFTVDAVTADVAEDAFELGDDLLTIDVNEVQSLAEGSPVVNLANYIIVHAVRQKASDIHIEPGLKSACVRYRVDGVLRDVLRPRPDIYPALLSRLKVMAKMDIAEHRAPQDGRIHARVENHEIDLRVSSLPMINGEKMVLRILDRKNVSFRLEALGVHEHQLKQIRRLLTRPYGLLLVTGPTGSGKTTTLYSAIELIKSHERNIVTVEDPVEYQLELINQVQVGISKSMTFANTLRSILRQDPDIIMIGEIRDAETAEIAIQASLTGHLVLSTLHTNDAPSAVTRLLDMGIAQYKIASSLVGVVAQRLVRTICPNCKTQYYPPEEQLQLIGYQGDRRQQFTRGFGCKNCFDSGFKGRLGIYEVLEVTPAVRSAIMQKPDPDSVRECHLQQGGTTLLQEGIRRAEEGLTSLEEVIRVSLTE